jgi:uncharacterized protein (DUF362 family)
MTPVVSVVQARDTTEEGINEATEKVIDLGGFSPSTKPRSVILKVNLRYYWDYSTGETTDPRVAAAIIDYIRGHYSEEADIAIAEADASAMRTKYAFKMLGYEKLSQEKSVRLFNLSESEKVEMEVAVNGRKFNLPIAKQILDADLLVNVPKLRTHRLTTVSCGLKNMFGAIAVPRKVVYHPHLDETIVGANKLMRPHLTIIDGIIALGRHPIKMGLILASQDQLAADFVAASVMGYDAKRVRHLTLAEKEGVGNVNSIQIVGVRDHRRFARMFPRENYFLFNLSWKLKLALLDMYLRIVNDTRPPALDRSRF